MVTDDKLFEELFNETETDNTSSTLLTLQFDKANGEQILIKLADYHLNAANFTIPEDKGPITVEGTVMPRSLESCTVKNSLDIAGVIKMVSKSEKGIFSSKKTRRSLKKRNLLKKKLLR